MGGVRGPVLVDLLSQEPSHDCLTYLHPYTRFLTDLRWTPKGKGVCSLKRERKENISELFNHENIRVQVWNFDENEAVGSGFLSVLHTVCRVVILHVNTLLLIHSSWQCLSKKTHQKGWINSCAHSHSPKKGKVLGNGWNSNREHFLWWPLAAPMCYGFVYF